MNISLAKLQRSIPGFNKRVITAEDFWKLVKREKIIVHFWHLRASVKGFYGVNRRYKRAYRYIVINGRLLPDKWLDTALHEIVHHFLHQPASNLRVYFSKEGPAERQDRQANNFVLMMKIPKPRLLELMHTPFDEICGYTPEEMRKRYRIYELYGE